MRLAIIAFGFCGLLVSASFAQDLQALSQNSGQWVMPARDYASTRFSPLDQVNVNVGQLHRVDVLGRNRPRTGGRAARRRRHDVCR